ILNYEKVAKWAEHLAQMVDPRIKSVILDEAQQVRKTDSAKYRGTAHVTSKVDYSMALSATPIFNYGSEIFNVLNCLKQDCLGTREEFEREWCNGETVKNPKALGTYLRKSGLMIRRTRKEVGREIPPVTISTHTVDADPAELNKIKGNAAELARFILQKGGDPFEKMRASEELSYKLRLATGIAKAPYVAEFVRMLVESGEKVLLFGWHHAVYDLWRDQLKDV